MYKKIISTTLLLTCLVFVTFAQSSKHAESDNTEKSGIKNKKEVYKIGEHVWVKMKDGTETESVVHGHHSKNKYYVRKWHSNRQGLVHKKYMRHMSQTDIAATHAKYDNKK